MARLRTSALSLDEFLAATGAPEAGALAVFAGTVRNHNDGRSVKRLTYTAFEPLAEKVLATIETETGERFDIVGCRIAHRLGRLEVGETSVLVVVRAVHRAEAFDAARYAIEAIKHRAPIWKLEEYADGSRSYVRGCSLDERHYEKA